MCASGSPIPDHLRGTDPPPAALPSLSFSQRVSPSARRRRRRVHAGDRDESTRPPQPGGTHQHVALPREAPHAPHARAAPAVPGMRLLLGTMASTSSSTTTTATNKLNPEMCSILCWASVRRSCCLCTQLVRRPWSSLDRTHTRGCRCSWLAAGQPHMHVQRVLCCVFVIFLYQVTVLASDRRLLVVMVCGCPDKSTGTRLC